MILFRVPIVCLLSLIVAMPASGADISCPAPETGLSVTASPVSTNTYGRSQLVCRYYDRQHKKGTVEVFYYGDYKRPRECGSRVYADADLRSWEFQIYAFVTDQDPDDFLTENYWKDLARKVMAQAEYKALPCSRKYKTPPPDALPRKIYKPKSTRQIESSGAAPGRPSAPWEKSGPTPVGDGW